MNITFAVVWLAAIAGLADSPEMPGYVVDRESLAVRVEPTRQAFAANEPVVLRTTFENHSDTPVRMGIWVRHFDPSFALRESRRGANVLMICMVSVEVPPRGHYVRYLPMDGRYAFPAGDHVVPFRAGVFLRSGEPRIFNHPTGEFRFTVTSDRLDDAQLRACAATWFDRDDLTDMEKGHILSWIPHPAAAEHFLQIARRGQIHPSTLLENWAMHKNPRWIRSDLVMRVAEAAGGERYWPQALRVIKHARQPIPRELRHLATPAQNTRSRLRR